MSDAVSLLAIAALVPAMLGGAPMEGERGVELALCGGGALTIDLLREPELPPRGEDCFDKACHSGCSRKRIDRAQ